MSTLRRALGPPATVRDQAIERHLTALGEELAPDPLFRRRVRSDVVNRFVAAREGIAKTSRPSLMQREMGRVGRACLFASFTLGVSAASVLAASQKALPGEVLYPLKQRIEELRVDALPAHLHGELAAYALGERIDEIGRLADAGHLELAVAMGPAIDRDYARLVALGASVDAPGGAARIERHLIVLEGLLATLPPNARDAVNVVMDGSPEIGRGNNRNLDPGTPRGVNPPDASAPTEPLTPTPTAKPVRAVKTAKPEPTAVPDATSSPTPTPKPEPTTVPDATSSPTPAPNPGRTPRPRPDPTHRPEHSAPRAATDRTSEREAQSKP